MYFYESLTVTPKDTYSDEALTTPNTNPVIADSQGQFGDIFLSGAYSCKLTDASDVTQPDYPAEIAATADTAASVLLTGAQTVAGVKTFTDRTAHKADTPIIELEENDAPVDNRLWQFAVAAEQFIMRLANDARDTLTSIFTVDRTGTTADALNIVTTNVQHNGVNMYAAIDEDNMVSDSAIRVPTQQSTKAYVDAQAGVTILEIGPWDMSTLTAISVAHGLSADQIKRIRGVQCVVRNDTLTAVLPITCGYMTTDTLDAALVQADSPTDTFIIQAKAGGVFDTTSFDQTSYTLDAAAAVDKGSGLVGIPITAHGFVAGDSTTLAGTTNYDATYSIISETANEIVITATYVAETFAGTETASWGRGWIVYNIAP
jgi:hypothetical protein